MKYLISLFTFVVVVGACSSPVFEVNDLTGTLWLRKVESAPLSFEAFFLGEKGELRVLDFFSSEGKGWWLEEGDLVLVDSVWGEQRFTIRGSAQSPKIEGFEDFQKPQPLSEGEWSLVFPSSIGGEDLVGIPPGADISTLEGAPTLTYSGEGLWGYGGVNYFRGALSLEGESWKAGPLMRTLMSGPALPIENGYLRGLEEATSYIVLDEYLFLFKENKLLLIMKATSEGEEG